MKRLLTLALILVPYALYAKTYNIRQTTGTGHNKVQRYVMYNCYSEGWTTSLFYNESNIRPDPSYPYDISGYYVVNDQDVQLAPNIIVNVAKECYLDDGAIGYGSCYFAEQVPITTYSALGNKANLAVVKTDGKIYMNDALDGSYTSGAQGLPDGYYCGNGAITNNIVKNCPMVSATFQTAGAVKVYKGATCQSGNATGFRPCFGCEESSYTLSATNCLDECYYNGCINGYKLSDSMGKFNDPSVCVPQYCMEGQYSPSGNGTNCTPCPPSLLSLVILSNPALASSGIRSCYEYNDLGSSANFTDSTGTFSLPDDYTCYYTE